MVVVTTRELQFPNYVNVVADLQKGLRNPAAQGPECLSFRFSGRIVGLSETRCRFAGCRERLFATEA